MRVENLSDDVLLFCADCRDVFPLIDRVDAVITDPPYGNSNHQNDFNSVLNLYRGLEDRPILNDDQDSMRDIVGAMLTQAARFLDSKASACCCFVGGGGPHVQFAWLVDRMDRDGLQFFHSVIWDKRNPGLGQRYRRQHEMIMVSYRKGSRIRWAADDRLEPNVWYLKPDNNREHPNEKPLEIMLRLVATHSHAGDIILDPFMGSGTTGVAAVKLGRQFIGIELEPKYFDIACRRIGDAVKEPDLLKDVRLQRNVSLL